MSKAMKDYLDSIGVVVNTVSTDTEPPKWAQGMHGYECTLMRNGEPMFTVPYYQGSARNYAPLREDIIHCLLSDRGTLQYSSDFTEWADGLGYNSDSISDKELFDRLTEQTRTLELHFTDQELSVLSALTEDY